MTTSFTPLAETNAPVALGDAYVGATRVEFAFLSFVEDEWDLDIELSGRRWTSVADVAVQAAIDAGWSASDSIYDVANL